MTGWRMGWGDDESGDRGDASSGVDLEPRPVPPGAVRLVRVVLHGFHALPADPLLVMWDDHRCAVRLPDGRLRWYADPERQAHPRDGSIVVEESGVLPRGNRAMDALVVRSLLDLVERVNAEEVVAVDHDGLVRLRGEHDDSSAEVVTCPGTGVVLRASGQQGRAAPWRLEVLGNRLVEGHPELLEPVDVDPMPG